MQLMIDTNAESPAAMRLCAQFLIDQAALNDLTEGTPAPAAAIPVLRAVVTPAAPIAPPAPPAPPAPDVVPADQQNTNNDGPLAPPAPAVPDPVASASAIVTPAAVPVVDEYDKSGIPFDGRIHQKSKNKKKDGTWKLQKGIADDLVRSVMQELRLRVRVPAPPALDAPTGLDPSTVFGQPLPAGVVAAVPVAPSAPAAPPAPAVPAGTPDAVTQLTPYRALVRKITEARAVHKITAEEVSACVAGAGAPSLQSLANLLYLIPNVEAAIDALLAVR